MSELSQAKDSRETTDRTSREEGMPPAIAPKEVKPHPNHGGGVQEVYEFPNGYGASVIKTPHSYGGDKGLWELAVLDTYGNLDYSTPITDDVLGYLTRAEVTERLAEIAALPDCARPKGADS